MVEGKCLTADAHYPRAVREDDMVALAGSQREYISVLVVPALCVVFGEDGAGASRLAAD